MKICTTCNQHYIGNTCAQCLSKPISPKTIAIGVLLGLQVTACSIGGGQSLYGVPMVEQDVDEDGFKNYEDCDDEDPYTYPGAAIEDSESACMTDFDGDGYGAIDPEENIEPGTDCDDTDPTINPGNDTCE